VSSERDVWATAQMLVEEYGTEAAVHAAMRADAMLRRGDVLSWTTSRRPLPQTSDHPVVQASS